MTYLLRTILIYLLAAAPARAELMWDSKRVELTPSPIDTQADARFGFVNAGTEPVTIAKIQSSCGCCTTASGDKTTYAPGERGEILARFHIGDRRGVNTKTVAVSLEGELAPTVLTLVVSIPEPVRITPNLLTWERSEANKAKTITVQALPNRPVRILRVTSPNPRLTTTVETVEEAKDYRIAVTPTSTQTPGFIILKIETLLMGQPRTFTAYAQIKPASR